MPQVEEIAVTPGSIARFSTLLGADRMQKAEEAARATVHRLNNRTWWNINSTATGGGVAEMLPSLLAYAQGVGVDARWLVITGTPSFFHLTKRLHHALHQAPAPRSARDAGGRKPTWRQRASRLRSGHGRQRRRDP